MSLDRRVQVLLDPRQYRAVEREAARSGQSVAAVIRDAIDARLGSAGTVRAAAARRLLSATGDPRAAGEDWAESKAALERAIDSKLP